MDKNKREARDCEIRRLLEEGRSYDEIAIMTKCSKTTVGRINLLKYIKKDEKKGETKK